MVGNCKSKTEKGNDGYVLEDGDCRQSMRAFEGDIGKAEATTRMGLPLNLVAKVLRSFIHKPIQKKLYTKADKK